MTSDELVSVGRVGRPHGLAGAFLVENASDDERRFAVGARLYANGSPALIEQSYRAGTRRALRLDRPVERGVELTVLRTELPPLDPDHFYVFQLVGLEVVSAGRTLGLVRDVLPGTANDNLELDGGRLVPLVEDAIVEIDLEGGRIDVASGFLLDDA